jgi:hypothetical protein
MAFTSTDLDTINAAIASGQRRVKLGNREIEYNTLSEMLSARDIIRNELNKTAGIASSDTRPLSYRIKTSKGL